jgi:glycosyltransferase involved in cell wall biosynthesis
LASVGLRVPAVVAEERALNKQRTGLRRLLDRVHGRWVDCWIGNSKAVVEHVSRDLGLDPARVCVIYNGIDARRFERAAALPLLQEKRREGLRVVLNLGNLRPVKNQLLFLQVCDRLRRRFPDLVFVFCGEGVMRGPLEARAHALGIADRTLFLGLQDDVAPVLAAADLLIQSSDDEGLPNAVMEAMCARVPIVATEAGGTRELIQDRVHGLVVLVRDEAGLEARAAELLVDKELAARFASAASERVRQEFSVEAMVRRYEDLFSRLVDEGRRKG